MKTYKEMFPGITDDEAAELTALFTGGMNSRNVEKASLPLRQKLAAAEAKYGKRDLWEDTEL